MRTHKKATKDKNAISWNEKKFNIFDLIWLRGFILLDAIIKSEKHKAKTLLAYTG